MFSIKSTAALGLAIGAAASATAQSGQPPESLPRLQAALDYSYMRANAAPGQCGCFNLNGGSMEVSVRAYKDLSAVFDLSGVHAGKTSIPGQSLSLLSYTAGPRFSYPLRRSERISVVPFVQGLVGGVHGFDGQFPGLSMIASSANGLAVLVGGGVDVPVGHRLQIQAVQVDYGLNHLPNNANNSENLLHVSTGVVFYIR